MLVQWLPLQHHRVSAALGPASWPSSYRFDELDNVVMSAHTSGITKGSEAESVKEIAKNLDNLALGKPLENVIRPGKPGE